MSGLRLSSKATLTIASLVMTGCVTQNIPSEVPEDVLEHSLSSLSSGQSFPWQGASGDVLLLSPLGTFRSGGRYCRDYEIGLANVRGNPVRRTACRINGRWTNVDQSELDL